MSKSLNLGAGHAYLSAPFRKDFTKSPLYTTYSKAEPMYLPGHSFSALAGSSGQTLVVQKQTF